MRFLTNLRLFGAAILLGPGSAAVPDLIAKPDPELDGEPQFLATIYDKPRDYPESFVVRLWAVEQGRPPYPHDPPAGVVMTLGLARELAKFCIGEGAQCIPRVPADDPCIVEVWL